MFSGLIYGRVMKAIKEHVAMKQREYDAGVKALEQELENKKSKLADGLVNEILGKII